MDRAPVGRRSAGARRGARTARRTVVLTRPEGRNEGLAARLRDLGFDVVVRPLVEIEPVETGPIELDGYDWLVLTSATGASELKRRSRGRARRVAAIGPATAEAWGSVDLVPAVSTQEGLLAELPRPAGRVLFAGAEGARPLLAEALGADVAVLYRTRPVRVEVDGDLAVVASPSAARALAAANPSVPVVSIGPETTAAAVAAGLRVAAEAATPDLDGLAAAVVEAG
ncbi:MAG TPA: uroporphyrinogen-III synthase [Gaiellaceae bacterium]|nr:uroporphyrinogen-III synthase [Gaiellaceae bacterium]